MYTLVHHTYHPVSYNTVEYGGYDSYRDEVTEDFCEKVGGHPIITTDILMTKEIEYN